MNQFDYKQFYRRHLPHIQPVAGKLFITYRLAGSLPQEVIEKLQQEKRQIKKGLEKITDLNKRKQLAYDCERRWFARYDAYLNGAKYGPQWLRDERIAGLVAESIKHRDRKVYRLDAFSIMPNHVHQVIEPLSMAEHGGLPISLAKIMHSLKLYTGTQANRLLARTGQFWQHENYDHVVRNDNELQRIIKYILNNPVKAGLVNSWDEWKWNYCRYSM